ncbi:MAG: aconitase family protein, partial [Planctomycetota bacterium]
VKDLAGVGPVDLTVRDGKNEEKRHWEHGIEVSQVCVGSCTNSSYNDLMTVGEILEGKAVAEQVSMTVSPGSRQVLTMATRDGALGNMISAGARLIENACGPCIGMGQAPASGSVTVRTFNRNFKGRTGTQDALSFLCSPETAVACALTGRITDPRSLGALPPDVKLPKKFVIDDRAIVPPEPDVEKAAALEIRRGPNIKPVPQAPLPPAQLAAKVLIKTGDNVTTDHIMPAGAQVLPLRSNIPEISKYVFTHVDATFAKRALAHKEAGGKGLIIGGSNYGQGSSREHAALAPMYLGIAAVLVKDFARIHRSNLINFGVVPLTFVTPADYDRFNLDDEVEFPKFAEELRAGADLTGRNKTKNFEFKCKSGLSGRELEVVLAGGTLNFTRQTAK